MSLLRCVECWPTGGIYLGADQEALVDGMFQVWVALAFNQGRGRRLAFKLLEG